MKARGVLDHKKNWVQTTIAVVGLVFTVLVAFNVVTSEQSAQAQPVINDLVNNAVSIIAGVTFLIGLFFKPNET